MFVQRMARIVVTGLAVRAPLGGYLSIVLNWVLGLQRLGHDVSFVEKPGWKKSCYDPTSGRMGDDCAHGVATLSTLLRRFGLGKAWCFVDTQGRHYGMSETGVRDAFRQADVFVDLSADALGDPSMTWMAEADRVKVRVFVDGEPGHYQPRLEKLWNSGRARIHFDHYYTVGLNVGTPASSVPTIGVEWRHIVYPVVLDLFPPPQPPAADAAFTTVMTWRAHTAKDFGATGHEQKDAEFLKFITLPSQTQVAMELAVGGDPPNELLEEAGWRVRPALGVSLTLESYLSYIAASRGEFSVCKNVYVATNSGWFGDRSGVYLASGRPVVMQDTGFGSHLPCGEGLFAVKTSEEAAAAIDAICSDYPRHSRAARAIAEQYLSTDVVLARFLSDIGL